MNIDRFDDRLREYALLMRLHRPIGIYLLLWPTLWALWLAGHGQPPQGVALVFVLGVVLTRSAGCVINDIADRDFDPQVTRTRDRPLAAQRVTLGEAAGLAVMLALLAFVLVLTQNALTIQLSFIGLVLAVSYPFMKRLHPLPQVHLGSPKKAIGTNTESCMLSGSVLGTAVLIDGMVQRIEEELGSPATLVVTGGLAKYVTPLCRHPLTYDPELLMKGLALLYQLNAPQEHGRSHGGGRHYGQQGRLRAKHPHPNRRTRREPEALVG